ncbi:MAG: hypothetical protein ACAI25_20325 [Planctomycetota bacterium]
MPRRHLKKDDRNTLCGLTLAPKYTKQIAPDRQSVTCGACELASRPRTAPATTAPNVEAEAFATVAAPDADAGAQAPRDHITGPLDTRAND